MNDGAKIRKCISTSKNCDKICDFNIFGLNVLKEIKLGFVGNVLEHISEKNTEKLKECIMAKESLITIDDVKDSTAIMNIYNTAYVVSRLSTNDKIIYFANLICNGYLCRYKVSNDLFEEVSNFLKNSTYNEIIFLIYMYKIQSKYLTTTITTNSDISDLLLKSNYYTDFHKIVIEPYIKENDCEEYEIQRILKKFDGIGYIEYFNTYENLPTTLKKCFLNMSFINVVKLIMDKWENNKKT